MKDKYGKRVKIGDYIKCDKQYSFDPSWGIIIKDWTVRVYVCSDYSNSDCNQKNGWHYFTAFSAGNVEKISKKEYLLMKLKE